MLRAGFTVLAVALSLVGAPSMARADEPTNGGDARPPAFRYTRPAAAHPLRAALEEGIVLGVGYLQYVTNKKANQADWDLAPDWSSVGKKLELSALTFDNNYFETNWLTHPLAGYFYYSAARTNRLSIPVSTLFTVLASTLWEYFGEIREHAAINDLVATPLTGVPLGEATLQLGALVERGRRTPGSTVASWLLAPFKNLHDVFDGLEPERAARTDDLGLPADVWHRVGIGGSGGVTSQQRGPTAGDGRLIAHSRIVSIPGYGFAGTRAGWFHDGEVTDLRLQVGVSDGQLVDLAFTSHVLPLGYATQSVARGEDGRLRGHGVYGGLHLGAEYGTHDYDRDRRRGPDRIALVALGATVEQRVHVAGWTLRTRLDGLANFAGVDAYALPGEVLEHGDIHLSSVLREKHYYHAYGATLRPRIEIDNEVFDGGGELRVDWFHSFGHRDVDGASTRSDFDASDRRLLMRAWLGVRPVPSIRTFTVAEWGKRDGWVTSTHMDRREIGLHAGAEVCF